MQLSHLAHIGLLDVGNESALNCTSSPGESEGILKKIDANRACSIIVQQPITTFEHWLRSEICVGVLSEKYPHTSRHVVEVACGWRTRFPGQLWARLARNSCATLIKEAREAVPVIAFVQQRVAELNVADGPVTILDLCSGLGFLSMLLAEMLPPNRVDLCVLLDKAWPLKGAGYVAKPASHSRRMNWDHIYDLPWPVPLTTRCSRLGGSTVNTQILAKIVEPAPGPVFILGIHLCGVLSIRAVEIFNLGPKIVGLVLKPCCLPPMVHAMKNIHWTLGGHLFSAREVCTFGKYNKNQWDGPQKATLEPRFRLWADSLYRGLLAQSKRCDRVPLVIGHYQDTYLFAERTFSALAPPLPEAGSVVQKMLQKILSPGTPYDALSVPENVSMRMLNRRFAMLTHQVSDFMQEGVEHAADAFTRIKEAFDAIRARRCALRELSEHEAGGLSCPPESQMQISDFWCGGEQGAKKCEKC